MGSGFSGAILFAAGMAIGALTAAAVSHAVLLARTPPERWAEDRGSVVICLWVSCVLVALSLVLAFWSDRQQLLAGWLRAAFDYMYFIFGLGLMTLGALAILQSERANKRATRTSGDEPVADANDVTSIVNRHGNALTTFALGLTIATLSVARS